MWNLLDDLKNYFENTPTDELDNDWREIEHLNDIGPDVLEYAEFMRRYLSMELMYSCSEVKNDNHTFCALDFPLDAEISADAHYYYEA